MDALRVLEVPVRHAIRALFAPFFVESATPGSVRKAASTANTPIDAYWPRRTQLPAPYAIGGRGGLVSRYKERFDLAIAARRLEACEGEASRRLAEAAASLFPDSGAKWARVGGGLAIYTGKTLPINRATGMGMEGPLGPGDWEAFESFYVSRGFPPELDICPMADASLFCALTGRDYRLSRFLSIHALHGRPPARDSTQYPEHKEIKVHELNPADPNSIRQWIRIVTGGFAGRPDYSESESQVFGAAARAIGTRLYLASYRGRPAGGGILRVFGQTALLSTASTAPDLRGRGIQAALLDARVHDAFGSGCDLVGVMASPGSASQRNILRAGFHEIYTKPVFMGIAGSVKNE